VLLIYGLKITATSRSFSVTFPQVTVICCYQLYTLLAYSVYSRWMYHWC